MALSQKLLTILCSLAGVLILSDVAVAQKFDETGEFCQRANKHCPDNPSKPYEKYCCIENYGGLAYPVCCSPYFGVEIGAGIGIPIVLLLIVAIVGGYCCCLKIQQRRLAAFRSLEDEESDGVGEAGNTPLQEYSQAGEDKPPTYSSDDPYPTPPAYTAEPSYNHTEDQAPDIPPSGEPTSDPPSGEDTIPLSVDSDTNDTIPLVGNGQEEQ